MWDFRALSPEHLQHVTILTSDRRPPKSYRPINGYGSHSICLSIKRPECEWN